MNIFPLSSPSSLPGDAAAPPSAAILLSVFGLSRLLHRANLLKCWVIPDMMTIFSSVVP